MSAAGDLGVLKVQCNLFEHGYYFDHTQFDKHITLRVKASKNNQATGINPASNYLRVP